MAVLGRIGPLDPFRKVWRSKLIPRHSAYVRLTSSRPARVWGSTTCSSRKYLSPSFSSSLLLTIPYRYFLIVFRQPNTLTVTLIMPASKPNPNDVVVATTKASGADIDEPLPPRHKLPPKLQAIVDKAEKEDSLYDELWEGTYVLSFSNLLSSV